MSITLAKGDAISLLINNVPMLAFVEAAGTIPKLVIYNPVTGTVKRFSGISSLHLEERLSLALISTSELPEAFKKVYDRHFLSYFKNDHVVFEQDGKKIEGVVVKGGNYIKVKFTQNGQEFTVKGEAYLFKPATTL